MRNRKYLVIATTLVALGIARAYAATETAKTIEGPASETAALSLGVFASDSDTSVRLGSGLGLDIDLEDTLALEHRTSVFRTEGFWRFTQNHKHRVDASWFALRRSAHTKLGQDIQYTTDNGNVITIPTGSDVDSHLNLDIIELAYSYSFVQDQRVDFAVIGGLYLMPIDFGLKSSGLFDTSRSFNLTAPLPVAGLRLDVALWPKWTFRSSSQIFAFGSDGFAGRLMEMRGGVEYAVVKHFALGVAMDNMQLSMDGKGAHFPGVDLRGKIDYAYTGFQLYGKVGF